MLNYFHPREGFNGIRPALKRDSMEASPEKPANSEELLQLVLFVDQRPSSREQIRSIRRSLQQLKAECAFELQVVDVGEQPYLAEHFKLIATPTLIKVYPEPRQTLTGSNLIAQLEHWWPRWQRALEEQWTDRNAQLNSPETGPRRTDPIASIACAAELMQLSDEIFRLKQEKEHLQEQLHFKDRIIAMLAHDLRNPLTATSLALETLELTKNAAEDEQKQVRPGLVAHLIKHARCQVRVMDRMVTDILQAAKGTNAQLQIQPQKLDLGPLCEDVLTQFKDRLQAKNLQIQTDIPKDLPKVYADPERVRQVIVNLLDNAIKYTPAKGTVEVSILHRTSQKVQVSICDSGPGIPEGNRDRIFEDHFRLQRDQSQEGYGIGLALCQRIIRAHYGQIWVDSGANSGSSFHFTLPVYR